MLSSIARGAAVILADIFLVLAALLTLYRALRPVQRRLEEAIRGFLSRDRRGVIDAQVADAGRDDEDKE